MRILPLLLTDSYKQWHYKMYPEGLLKLYSNMTPRGSRIGVKKALWFGLNYYLKEYLVKQWNELFFDVPLDDVLDEYERFHKYFSGMEIDVQHIKDLHELGYLPLKIKALPEGIQVNLRVPFYTITNTVPGFGWLVNFLETPMSTVIWDMTTVATISYQYRLLLSKYAIETTGSVEGVQWQAHDFSMRGRSSVETSQNQAGHLLSFTGTDTIPAVLMLEEYYSANIEKELVGSSVPATEHSVMTSFGKESEMDAFRRILKQFPKGVVSVVADSYDLFSAIARSRKELYDEIMERNGKLVYRPDSGDPCDIICGLNSKPGTWSKKEDDKYYFTNSAPDYQEVSEGQYMGVIELLWSLWGGTVNDKGYKVLDPHVGAIYGDSITLERAEQICKRLQAKGFASTNVVFGIGSYTFNYRTRDSLGIAVKSTYCEVKQPAGYDFTGQPYPAYIEKREIFKDPITDDGTKKSAKGLLRVDLVDDDYILTDQVTEEEEERGALLTVFEDGDILIDPTLAEIRKRVDESVLQQLTVKVDD